MAGVFAIEDSRKIAAEREKAAAPPEKFSPEKGKTYKGTFIRSGDPNPWKQFFGQWDDKR